MTNQGLKLTFKFERETKGAVRYQEVDESGHTKDAANGAAVGTLYIRKTALNGNIPMSLMVTVAPAA